MLLWQTLQILVFRPLREKGNIVVKKKEGEEPSNRNSFYLPFTIGKQAARIANSTASIMNLVVCG